MPKRTLSLGWFLFFGREFTGAFEAMDRAVAPARDNPMVLDDIAQALIQVGYINEAAAALARRAATIDPLVPIYQKTLGVIYMEGKAYFSTLMPMRAQ
ncbi:MAG: hypothetical protein U5K38_07530 [Woeseiaceae bacterium]|nr:hypothetical protein [Woeseiaceae bacterium]